MSNSDGKDRTNTEKASTLVVRLANKTKAGLISWDRFTDGSTFQTRQGDYVITLSMTNFGTTDTVLIQSTRLDGFVVFTAAVSQQLISIGSNRLTELTQKAAEHLQMLYDNLSNENSDLDALLKLI